MTLTTDDIRSIKGLLDGLENRVNVKIADGNTRLTAKIDDSNKQLTAKIDKLKDETIGAIGDLADQPAVQKTLDGLTRRVEKLERLQKTS